MICTHCKEDFEGKYPDRYCSTFCKIYYNSEKKESGCREWKLQKSKDGYGRVRVGNRIVNAHRQIYEMHHRIKLPFDIKVCHKCDNPSCVNIEHLFAGTHSENMLDCVAKGRHPDKTGGKNGCAKLDWQKVYEIREKYNNGKLRAEIAREYGVTYMTIQHIIRNNTWRTF